MVFPTIRANSSSLDLTGKTQAEVCGIKIEGENKWVTLIQNVSM